MLVKEVQRDKLEKTIFNIKFKVFLNMFVRISQYLYFEVSSMQCLLHLIKDYVDPFISALQDSLQSKLGI